MNAIYYVLSALVLAVVVMLFSDLDGTRSPAATNTAAVTTTGAPAPSSDGPAAPSSLSMPREWKDNEHH